jgi:hypothetical protein
MKQGSSGPRVARHRPKHARGSGLTLLRSVIGLAFFAGLAVAVGIAGSGGPTGVGVAHAAVPHQIATEAAPALTAEQGGQLQPGLTVGGAQHSLGTSAGTTSDAPDAGLAPISDGFPASGLAADGIPITALTAYQAAAVREASRTPSCGLTWPLLAGIGRVESDHGRFAGATLHSDGLSTPPVIGIPLNGNGTALIRDTDNGALDGDTVYDRAVGPMQFIPSTWAGWGVDANGDGVKDPFNIFDAAAAAADYLCAAGRDLTTTHGQVQAILSYNYSWDYVSMVMGLEKVYASGAVGITVPVLPTTPDRHGPPKHQPSLPPVDPGKPVGTGSGGGSEPSPTPTSPHPKPPTSTHPTPRPSSSSPAPEPSSPGSSGSGSGSSGSSGSGSSGSGTGTSSESPSPTETTCPSGANSGSPSESASTAPAGCGSPSASDPSDGSSSADQSPPLSSDAPTGGESSP